MSGGKARGKQSSECTDKQPDEGSVVTRRDTAAAENEVLDPFAAALEAIPAEDWGRTWAAGRTIMLRRTSKRVKEVVNKMRLPAVVRLCRSFWDDARNGTEKEKCRFVLRQLTGMSALCRITTLELRSCAIT